VRLAERTKM